MDKKKSTGLLLSILGVLSLVLITAGVTYAFFTYTKEGSTENTITTGTIKFLYNEKEGVGNGILIENAAPVDDVTGKALSGTNGKFDFVITSTTPSTATIKYDVTARKTADSTLGGDQVKLYLESSDSTGTISAIANNGSIDTGKLYSLLPDYTTYSDAVAEVTLATDEEERLLYTGTVNQGQTDYANNLTLRMWIKGGKTPEDTTTQTADYSPLEYKNITAASVEIDDATQEGGKRTITVDPKLSTSYITSEEYFALPTERTGEYTGPIRSEFSLMFSETGEIKDDSDFMKLVDFKANAEKADTDVTKNATQAGYKQVQIYPLSGLTFTVKVNVYANAAVVPTGATSTSVGE